MTISRFDAEAYRRRLRLLREIAAGGASMMEFSAMLGIKYKRWYHYECGYPLPREAAWLLMEKFPGISVEWIWFGWPGNLSVYYRDKIELVREETQELPKARKKRDSGKAKSK